MQSINSIYILLFLCLIGVIEALKKNQYNIEEKEINEVKEQSNSGNKYYIISIKDSSKYSFDIQPTKQEYKLRKKDLNNEELKFIPIDMDEVEQIVSSDDCYSELNDINLNATVFCKSDNLLDNGKLDVKELEKTLKPKSSFVSKQMEELAELIIDNIDTYKKDEIVNEEVHNMIRKRKRSDSINDIFESEAFEKILKKTYTILDVTVVYAYLSDYLRDVFEGLPNVSEIKEDFKIPFVDVPEELAFRTKDGKPLSIPKKGSASKNDKRGEIDNYYNITDIKKDTKWKQVSIEKEAGHHLSLISQSRVNLELIGKYDTNYYYPSSAGEGVDIYFIDSGINVNHVDFDTTYRTVTCDAIVSASKYNKIKPGSKLSKNCTLHYDEQYHGISVASAAAGTINGVAKKANIHMIAMEGFVSDYIAALEYIKDYAKNPAKTIINISSGNFEYINVLDKLFNLMIRKGFKVFAAAGNEATDACITAPRYTRVYGMVNDKNYPGSYVDVISVGSITNNFEEASVTDDSDLYISSPFSNIGECIDIFAPGYAYLASFPDDAEEGKIYDNTEYTWGTSFSSPITAGAAALIIAENPSINYDQDLIKKTLIDLSVKGVITDLDQYNTPNRLLNIGKLVVYSSDNVYKGCGLRSGKMSCSKDNCCSRDGYCGTEEEFCEVECQTEFGKCSINNHPIENKPKNNDDDDDDKDSNFRDTWVYNYYKDLCLKFAPDNYLDESIILTTCDPKDEDAIWHISKKGETQIIQNFYEDVCVNFDEEGLAYAESCRTGTQIGDITTITKEKDLIMSDEFPGKCLRAIDDDYDPYGITIFTENKGLRVKMEECDVEDEYQHWRLRDVPGVLEEEEDDDDDLPLGPIEDDDEFGPIEDDDEFGPIEGDDNENKEEEEKEEEEEKTFDKRGLGKKVIKKIVKNKGKKINGENKQKIIVKHINKCKPKKEETVNEEEEEEEIIKVNEGNNVIEETEGISSSDDEEITGEAETLNLEEENEEEVTEINIEPANEGNEEEVTEIKDEPTNGENEEEVTEIKDEPTNGENEEEVTEIKDEPTNGENEEEVTEIKDEPTNGENEEEVTEINIEPINEEEVTEINDNNEIYNDYGELFNPEDYIECRTFEAVVTNTKKVWIYNVEKKLCLTFSGKLKDSLRLEKCETNNKYQKWLISNKEDSYIINQEKEEDCIIYTPDGQLIINECIENILLNDLHYVKNHAAIINFRDDDKLGIRTKNEEEDLCFNNLKENVIDAVPCEKANATWKLTVEFPN
ncbi:hypothetical protein BCR32DRAFT_330606 [Anaeromyces robustus]|uniref:Chitin-binding type-1 domain-containing protein n=1 Tax=Anaeromyces robustus TaxID=1754192 RepID=A0A1Y1VUP4_9FUNG|nr:hypothetical protein BCR32DRAFT_330606 [Anaeromyces robustus]|eukprot:ORX64474.1 hypothetical protein BCR32DRAFT_330606 [Anaeromyces robustus]